MSTRRHVLQLLATAPALAACSTEALPDPVAAWRDPGAGEQDPRRFALAHAILAPNPHNTQAWQVALDDSDGMTLYCDLERRLPATDPLDRQITIGCGCFLELYRLAAASRGYQPTVTYFPEGEPTPRLDQRAVAHVKLGQIVGQPGGEPIFTKITERRTNRTNYEDRAPAEADFAALDSVVTGGGEEYPGAVKWISDRPRVEHMRDLIWQGWDRELRTEAAAAETYGWLRFGKTEIARHGDGLAIDAPGVGIMRAIGMLGRDELINPDSSANKQAAEQWRAMAMSAPAFLWLTTAADTPTLRLVAGKAYARIALTATERGLKMHPWSQTLQEYPEMAELYSQMRAFLNAGDETVQMLVRIGYAAQTPPAPRRGYAVLLRT